jgi:uncharacterized phage-associated protein
MYSSFEIANDLIEKGINSNNPITPLKLQKELYLANGFYIAKYGNPLLIERFKAWKYGPVIPSIYHEYKDFGDAPITRLTTGFNQLVLSADVNLELEKAWEIGCKVDAITLSNWTHAPGSPWKKAIDANNEYIDNNDLIEYFGTVFNIQRVNQ